MQKTQKKSSFVRSIHCSPVSQFEKTRSLHNMGKIRTKTVKRASRQVVEKYFAKLGHDY